MPSLNEQLKQSLLQLDEAPSTRMFAANLTRKILNENGLKNWHVRIAPKIEKAFLGMCSYKDKTIILNAHHVDIHPSIEVRNSINHEVAHALCPGHGHDDIWEAKARELGCDNTEPCSTLNFPPYVVDAIRSGATLEVEYTEQVIRKPKYKVSRLQDKCPECNKVARELYSTVVTDDNGDEIKTIILECYHTIIHTIPKATPFHEFITASQRDNGCDHTWEKNHCTTCDGYKLFPFQVEGARFIETALATGKGAGLFDEMGLGKTVQPLAYLHYHPEQFPVLFIVKSGVKFQFFKEIIRFLGLDHFSQMINTSRDSILPGLKTYIISYDLLRRFDTEKLLSIGFKTCIIDECQQIKNADSSRTKEVRKIVDRIPSFIPLSGTPWKNRGSEFFPVLNMLSPMKFPSNQGFLDRWVDHYWNGQRAKEGGIKNPKKFKEYISDIAIRRERKNVMSELPLISRNLHFTELEGAEAKIYENEVSDFVRFYNEEVIGGDGEDMATQTNMLARLARMRHITGLAKIPTTVEFTVNHINETGRKIVIFVHHKDVGELITEELRKQLPAEIPVLQLTASLSSAQRFDIQEQFNGEKVIINIQPGKIYDSTVHRKFIDKGKDKPVVLVASTLAAGEGLNLQTCCDCILHERQWNPANEEQAEGRFIRIGQTSKSVIGTYPTASGTVDEHLARLVEEKRVNFHNAMNNDDGTGTSHAWNQGDIIKELASRIVQDANKVTRAAML